MSKKAFKSQASSSRAFSGNPLTGGGFGSSANTFSHGPSSTLSYIYEPPDLSTLSDPAVGVSFKALQKKDSTTKHKALEDLNAYVTNQAENKQILEDSFLEAWTTLFPRTAIDNSNRVRQLAYTLHGKIVALCGKVYVKHMPATVGAWLAGLSDRERQVSRIARESLTSTFTTEEKRKGVWKAFQESILEYCLNTIQQETIQTLSDERMSSPDDAQAKYSRAISGALLTLTGLLDVLSKDDLSKHTASYEQCLKSDAVWKLSSSSDGALRRATYRLAVSALDKFPGVLDTQQLGNSLLKQLSTDQTGSAYEFIGAIIRVTKTLPEIWTTSYATSAKKSSSTRLESFLRKGSFGIGAEFYKQLTLLLDLVPVEVLRSSDSIGGNDSGPLTSLREGVTGAGSGRRDVELQPQDAWQCYLRLASRILENTTEPETRTSIVADALLPIVAYHVEPNLVTWGRNWPENKDIVLQAFHLAWKYDVERTKKELEAISKDLIETLQMSLPEQSKDFTKSQEAVIKKFRNWYDLQTAIIPQQPKVIQVLQNTANHEVEKATDLLKTRNSKPYAAATILEELAKRLPSTSLETPETAKILETFAKEVIPKSMQSPSAPALLRLLEAMAAHQDIQSVLDSAITELLAAPSSSARSAALQSLARSYWPSDPGKSAKLRSAVLENLQAAISGDNSSWSLPFAVLESSTAPSELDQDILGTMLEGLSMEDRTESSIHGFTQLANRNNSAFRMFASSSEGSGLLPRLLHLSHQSNGPLQEQATHLRDAVSSLVDGTGTNTMTAIIRDGVFKTDLSSLSIDSLCKQAQSYLTSLPVSEHSKAVLDMLPDVQTWKKHLTTLVERLPNREVSIIDLLGGAVNFVKVDDSQISATRPASDHADGDPAAIRAAIFVARIFKNHVEFDLPDATIAELYHINILVAITANDLTTVHSESVRSPQSATEHNDNDCISQYTEIRDFARSLLSKTRHNSSVLSLILRNFLEGASGQTPQAYYHARAYADTIQALGEGQPLPVEFIPDKAAYWRLRNGSATFKDLAALVPNVASTANQKLFNELISDHAAQGAGPEEEVLGKYVTLNILLRNELVDLEDVPKQRLVYFVKGSVDLLQKSGDNDSLQTEIFGALRVLPYLADIYDEFWETIVKQCAESLTQGNRTLPTIHAILRLSGVLQKMLKSEVNEDLTEAWAKIYPEIIQGRLDLLLRLAKDKDQSSQPRHIVYDILCRQIMGSPPSKKIRPELVYPALITTTSTVLLRALYHVLGNSTVASQQQLSIDAALNPDLVPELDSELLKIVARVPLDVDEFDLRNESDLPAPLARYLFSWKLIFSHWPQASYKVRAAYVASLKNTTCVESFLAFVFEYLIEVYGGRNKAGFDTSKLPSVTTYEIINAENPGTEFIWLLCNIYYNILLHTPHLAKAWHTNSCPRAIKSQTETWTSKHISPLVITEELKITSEWQPPSDTANSELTLKISPKASEVTASLPLDETYISIKIHLPPSYPLAPISLSTVQRMGIDEKRWTSYLLTSRMVMNFSSTSQGQGAVIDGISAWRNNVMGALDGHSECAICYSVVAEDGKVPNKKCGTCGHLFHGGCLYRWFQRSAGSSCPLCRNSFVYA